MQTSSADALIDRQAAKDPSVANRRAALEWEIRDVGEKLARLYRAIEEGVAEIDVQLRERITGIKSVRGLAQVSLERIAAQPATAQALTPERIAALGDMLRQKMEAADIQAWKAYLHSIVSEIRVDDHRIQIIADMASLAAVIAGQLAVAGNFVVVFANGAPDRIRTHDPQIRSLVLYPAELRALTGAVSSPLRR